MDKAAIDRAKEHFGKLLEEQMRRMERVKSAPDWIDYRSLQPIKIGLLGGDGIGPSIAGMRTGFLNSCCGMRSRAAKS